jgi:hypothetical protein
MENALHKVQVITVCLLDNISLTSCSFSLITFEPIYVILLKIKFKFI